jgi:hypothetical protein
MSVSDKLHADLLPWICRRWQRSQSGHTGFPDGAAELSWHQLQLLWHQLHTMLANELQRPIDPIPSLTEVASRATLTRKRVLSGSSAAGKASLSPLCSDREGSHSQTNPEQLLPVGIVLHPNVLRNATDFAVIGGIRDGTLKTKLAFPLRFVDQKHPNAARLTNHSEPQ